MRPIDADGLLFMKADISGLFDEKSTNPNHNLWEMGYQACLKNVQKQVASATTIDCVMVQEQNIPLTLDELRQMKGGG